MNPIIEISDLNKVYAGGFQALKNIHLKINKGEIFALLGPNGAGKTTMISIVCGIVNPTSGNVKVDGHDIAKNYRHTRSLIGLVPQEIATDSFETVFNTVSFSRGLFNKPKNPAYVEDVLRKLTLWEKRKSKIMTLSGGMKRRLMIAKALAHEPKILFLDEPTAGVDVELRKNMWQQVRALREAGVTIILTTHYIEEAEELADRIGVINHGELIVIEEKKHLMKKLGKKELSLELKTPLTQIPNALSKYDLKLGSGGYVLTLSYDSNRSESGITDLLDTLREHGVAYRDIYTKQSSLEEIFVQLVHQ